MNREIKFRLWNDYDKKMINWDELLWDETSAKLPNIFTNPSYRKWLMQYTGLKDRKGKEIYEGDVIEDLDYGYMACKFINGSFVWQSIKNEFYIKFFTYIPNIEVTGNIYENPELLEV